MEILFALLGAFAVYLLQGILYSYFWDKGLSAEISFSRAEIGEGESCELKEVIISLDSGGMAFILAVWLVGGLISILFLNCQIKLEKN